jgi:methionyl-tRNA formyltransferase
MFSMCIDIKIPEKIFSAPRLGTFLWHEGITPEYKGLYSAFWALYNRDYEKIGYTLLKINKTIDGGKIFVQGQAKDIDPLKDCWGYLAHKSIYDSLPEVELFLKKLETSSPEEIVRVNAPSKYYTRPGLTQLLSILIYRLTQYAKMKHRS